MHPPAIHADLVPGAVVVTGRLVVDIAGTDAGPDELVLEVSGNRLSGWQAVEVTLRAEGFPNSFEISLSSKNPATSNATVASAGQACSVSLGSDVVITGYIDRDIPSASSGSHMITIVGRGVTQDLVDCSAEWPSATLQGTALEIATKLAQPYGITVKLAEGASAGDPVPPICINYTDTGAATIQRVAQNAGLLAYEDGTGTLVLATLGTKQAASGVVYGQNVQAFQVENSMDQRYSEVVCCAQSLDAMAELRGSDFFDTETDPNVPRHRRLNIVMEQVAQDPPKFTIQKAKWEIARRAGRSTAVTATVDSWRDSAGALWMPNTLVPVDVPGLRLDDKTLCISQVTFRRSDEEGTTAVLVMMPKFAFLPEPISLLPINAADAIGPDNA